MCAAPLGGWWGQSNLLTRLWTPAREAAGWERGNGASYDEEGKAIRDPFVWTWHSLRYYAATDWLGHGAPIQAVSHRMGHETLESRWRCTWGPRRAYPTNSSRLTKRQGTYSNQIHGLAVLQKVAPG
jgi:integrase